MERELFSPQIIQVSQQSQSPDSTWGSGGPNPLAVSHMPLFAQSRRWADHALRVNVVVQQWRLGTTGLCEKQDDALPSPPQAYLLTVLTGKDDYAL